jgi:predicted PurR-regulated permease PerM
MITTLGGMAVFGVNGFSRGPTIAAMCIAVWHLSFTAPPAPAGD